MSNNILVLINHLAAKLQNIYPTNHEQQQVVWWLLQALLHKSEAQLLTQQEIILSPEQKTTLNHWIHEHVHDNKPLQYIIGTVPFGDVEILVAPPVLIPRPETEEWCIALIKKLATIPSGKWHILDLCTGSGCVALALAQALLETSVVATDISPQALHLAKKNATHNNIKNISFLQADIYEGVPAEKRFDLIVSNPPYIAPEEWTTLSPTVTKWEDKQALVAPDHGLALIKRIINNARTFLLPNETLKQHGIPQLLIEIGYQQGPIVQQLMQKAGFNKVAITKDYANNDRTVGGGL